MAENCLIAYGNVVDNGTFSGGAWLPSLPLTNLQERILGIPARSVDVQLSSTQFMWDGGKKRVIGAIGLAAHNLSITAKYRIRSSETPDFSAPVFDSGWQDVWPVVYEPSQLDWASDNFWSGKYEISEIEGYNWTLVVPLDKTYSQRYWLFEFDDRYSTEGFVSIGRPFMGAAWQPAVNMSYGASMAWEDNTEIQTTISGAEYYDSDAPAVYRVARFSTDWMSVNEGNAQAFEIQRKSGTTKEVLYRFDPDDVLNSVRQSFLGRLRQLSPLEYPLPNLTRTGWEIKELV